MLRRSYSFRLLTIALLLCFFPLLPSGGSAGTVAQDDSLSWDRSRVRVAAAPARPRRSRVRPRPPRQTVPLLTLQWRVIKMNASGQAEETNPQSVFHFGDRLRLAVTVNQPGFLYIIHQPTPESNGRIIFPDSRLNEGRNEVARNVEFVLPPANCPAPNPATDCWFPVTPPTGREVFTVVFSRDLLLDLPTDPATAASGISPQVIARLQRESGQQLQVRSRPAGQSQANLPAGGRYAVWVTNTNRRDNEDIILSIPLVKGD